jgi:hypothetical protein
LLPCNQIKPIVFYSPKNIRVFVNKARLLRVRR